MSRPATKPTRPARVGLGRQWLIAIATVGGMFIAWPWMIAWVGSGSDLVQLFAILGLGFGGLFLGILLVLGLAHVVNLWPRVLAPATVVVGGLLMLVGLLGLLFAYADLPGPEVSPQLAFTVTGVGLVLGTVWPLMGGQRTRA